MKNLLQFGSLVIALTTLKKNNKNNNKNNNKKKQQQQKKKKSYLTGNSDFTLKSLMTVNW